MGSTIFVLFLCFTCTTGGMAKSSIIHSVYSNLAGEDKDTTNTKDLKKPVQSKSKKKYKKPSTQKPEVLDTTLKVAVLLDSTNTAKKDTNMYLLDSTNIIDSTKQDSNYRKRDTTNFAKGGLDAVVNYASTDSAVFIVPTQVFTLYGNSKIDYKNLDIKAGTIIYHQSTQQISAYGAPDSATNPDALGKALFNQANANSVSDTIKFNMRTSKGLSKNTFYNEGEMFVNANRFKREPPNIVYAYKGTFTTCNLDTPHYAFKARKMKMITEKYAFTGPATFEIEGVPMPFALPFGLFPLNNKRHSGILFPQFTASPNLGLGLEGLGWYQVINDHIDARVWGNIYTYGGWNINVASAYVKRYRFTGNITFAVQKTKLLNTTPSVDPNNIQEFTTGSSFLVQWSHNQDTKALPGVTFSANVNFGSNKYNQYVPNNPVQNYQNQLSSSISFGKSWQNGVNLSLNITHSQNSVSRQVSINLPTMSISVPSIYPFQKKNAVGTPRWYEKFSLAYAGNFLNQTTFVDSTFSWQTLPNKLQYGATHNVTITFPQVAAGPIIFVPTVNPQQTWIGQKVLYQWNPNTRQLDTNIYRGLYATNQITMGVTANTRIYGTGLYPNGKTVLGIRHVINPSVGFSYSPSLVKNSYYKTQIDTFGNFQEFSQYQGGAVGGNYSNQTFAGLNFQVDNNLEIKVKVKGDTAKGSTKKIRILDGFGFSGSYNLVADSQNLSPINLYARGNILNNKVNISTNATLDPYSYNQSGFRTAKYAWAAGTGNKFSIGSITQATISLSTSFQGGKNPTNKKKKDSLAVAPPTSSVTRYLDPEEQKQLDYYHSLPHLYVDFNIPWQINLSYSLNYSRAFNPGLGKFLPVITSSLNAQGDITITKKWKVSGSTYFDFISRKIQSLSMTISRDLHCWQMNITLTPVGIYRSFSISITPKSPILRDLKVNRTRTFYNQ